MKNLMKDGRKVPAMPTRKPRKGTQWQLVKCYYMNGAGIPMNSQGVAGGRGWQYCWWWEWKQTNTATQRKRNAEARKQQRARKKK